MNLEFGFNQNNLSAYLQISSTPTSITKISYHIQKNENKNQMKDDIIQQNKFFLFSNL